MPTFSLCASYRTFFSRKKLRKRRAGRPCRRLWRLENAAIFWQNLVIDSALADYPPQLRRQLGPVGLLFISTGSVIGSAWLFAAMYAAQMAGPAAILSWILAAIATLLLALVYAELGAAFPVAGGLARF
jgi:amino acid permease